MWGWAGAVREFLRTPDDVVLRSLTEHHQQLWLAQPASSQVAAWRDELDVIRASLAAVVIADTTAVDEWSLVFEYELPLEGGRRPDVVVLTGASMAVLEFKSTSVPSQADLDQVANYARDLGDYHEES